MSWNYRVVRFDDPEGGEPDLQVMEVYYDATGGLQNYCDPCLSGSSFNELQGVLRQMEAALRLPSLDAKHFRAAAA